MARNAGGRHGIGHRIRSRVAIVGIAVGLLAFGVAGQAGAVGSTAVQGIAVFRLGDSFSKASGYDRYAYVEVGIGDAAAAGQLNTTSLVYTSGTDVPVAWNSGVPYSQALTNGWLLKDVNGNYLMNSAYGRYIGDFGDTGYQQAFVSWVSSFLAENHNEGIEIDDVLCDARGLTGGTYPAKYPNQQAWENAQVSFISNVGDALRARGYYVLVNANCFIRGNSGSDDGSLTAAFWRRLAPHVSGLESEYWLQLPTDPMIVRVEGTDDWTHFWSGWQSLVGVAQSNGVDFFAEMYGTGPSTNIMRYGRASFLLDWNGKGGAFVYEPDDGATDPWNPEWTLDVGAPAAAKYRVGVGWRRDYTGGVALVNPDPGASQQFALGGTYITADGASVTAVTLGPGEGLVLRKSQDAPNPAPAPQQAPAVVPVPAPSQVSALQPSPAPAALPAPLTSPSVVGVARAGQMLTVDPGTWSGSPTAYAYRWERCDTGLRRCRKAQTGTATGVLRKSDVGSRIRVTVTASNAFGSSSATAITPTVAR